MKRWLALVAIAATLGLGLTITAPPGIAQAIVSPSAPPPINVLPSIVKAATGALTGSKMGDATLVFLYKAAKQPVFWEAVRASQAGTATAAQTTAVTAGTAGYAVPATKLGTLAKGAGVAGMILGSLSVGAFVGTAGLNIAGVDSEGLVCSTGGPAEVWQTIVAGLDCSAFIALLYKDAGGGDLPRTAREISEVGAHIDAGALQPGDLVFFRNTQGGIAHVGIYVGGENFVHASRKHGVIYQSRLNEPYWKSRFKGARRLPQS